jgi:hypothetical protein
MELVITYVRSLCDGKSPYDQVSLACVGTVSKVRLSHRGIDTQHIQKDHEGCNLPHNCWPGCDAEILLICLDQSGASRQS